MVAGNRRRLVFMDGTWDCLLGRSSSKRGGLGGGHHLKVQHCRAESERKGSRRREEVGHMLCIYVNLQ